MGDWIKLREVSDGEATDVLVNLARVVTIYVDAEGQTIVHTTGGGKLIVAESPEQIMNAPAARPTQS